MEIPAKIQFKKDFKDESKVFAKFVTNDFPEFIRVKGTDDFAKVKKNKKEWYSKCKYPSLAITLQFFKNNIVVKEPQYNAAGDLITSPPLENACEVIGFDARIAENNNVIIEWQTVKEQNVKMYELFFQENLNASFQKLEVTIAPKGTNQLYSIRDTSETDKSMHIFYLYVYFNNGINDGTIASNPVFEDNYL